MQNKLHKSIYREFVYCDPNDHLMKTDNKLTRPKYNCKQNVRPTNEVLSQRRTVEPQLKRTNEVLSHRRTDKPTDDDFTKIVTIQSDITGHHNNITNEIRYDNLIQNITPNVENCVHNNSKNKAQIIYDEDTFNQIELRGFITKELLKQSLEKGSNLFHIAEDIFDELCDKYHQFKEILHTLTTEFDNTIQCVIDTGKELTKKISHIIYELYLAVMHKVQSR